MVGKPGKPQTKRSVSGMSVCNSLKAGTPQSRRRAAVVRWFSSFGLVFLNSPPGKANSLRLFNLQGAALAQTGAFLRRASRLFRRLRVRKTDNLSQFTAACCRVSALAACKPQTKRSVGGIPPGGGFLGSARALVGASVLTKPCTPRHLRI